jgi:hypothetical protein
MRNEMHPLLRNILAVILGWAGGSLVNMGIIQLGHTLVPIEGVDTSDMAAIAEVMPGLGIEYFIFPLLAHALGTLVGSFIAAKLAASRKMAFAYLIGALFLIGGIIVSFMLPAPLWFIILDLLLAYLPMAYIGGKMALK